MYSIVSFFSFRNKFVPINLRFIVTHVILILYHHSIIVNPKEYI